MLRGSSGRRVPYFLTVDWFSFGCVLYEFITGQCPFRTARAKTWKDLTPKEKAIDTATLEMEPEYHTGMFSSSDAVDICTRLLDKNPSSRLGANGAEEVMAHPFFDSEDWRAHQNNTVEPPYAPRADLNMPSQRAIGHFRDENMEQMELMPRDMEWFEDWDYIRSLSFLEEVVDFKVMEEQYVSSGCALFCVCCCVFVLYVLLQLVVIFYAFHNAVVDADVACVVQYRAQSLY
jgi:serine/threonine protein kinase